MPFSFCRLLSSVKSTDSIIHCILKTFDFDISFDWRSLEEYFGLALLQTSEED